MALFFYYFCYLFFLYRNLLVYKRVVYAHTKLYTGKFMSFFQVYECYNDKNSHGIRNVGTALQVSRSVNISGKVQPAQPLCGCYKFGSPSKQTVATLSNYYSQHWISGHGHSPLRILKRHFYRVNICSHLQTRYKVLRKN